MKKLRLMNIKKDVLSRDEMKSIMAGSGCTNYVVCKAQDGTVCEICATFDGTYPCAKCSATCAGSGGWRSCSWGTAAHCSGWC